MQGTNVCLEVRGIELLGTLRFPATLTPSPTLARVCVIRGATLIEQGALVGALQRLPPS
ncbi:MAG: hypothetical protein O6934_04850 [SAR324 cluster bacterium]|nr:hypothetical protein [SAR324 cluster bacterium]